MKWRDLPYSQATWEILGEDCGFKGVANAIAAYNDLRLLMDPRKKERKRGRKHKVTPEVSFTQLICRLITGISPLGRNSL